MKKVLIAQDHDSGLVTYTLTENPFLLQTPTTVYIYNIYYVNKTKDIIITASLLLNHNQYESKQNTVSIFLKKERGNVTALKKKQID